MCTHTNTHMLTWQLCQDSRGWWWGRCDLTWIPDKLKFHLTPQEDHQKLWRLSRSVCVTGNLWQTASEVKTRKKPHTVLWLFREVCLSQRTLPPLKYLESHTQREWDRHTGSCSVCIILPLLWFWATFRILNIYWSYVWCQFGAKQSDIVAIPSVMSWSNQDGLCAFAAKLTGLMAETYVIIYVKTKCPQGIHQFKVRSHNFIFLDEADRPYSLCCDLDQRSQLHKVVFHQLFCSVHLQNLWNSIINLHFLNLSSTFPPLAFLLEYNPFLNLIFLR